MGRNRVEINPKSGKRLREWLERAGITQKELAERIYVTQQYINRVCNGRANLTWDMASRISEQSPSQFGAVRVEWLLGYDDYMTEGDRIRADAERRCNTQGAIETLLNLHGYRLEDVTEAGPVLKDEAGREYQESKYALISPSDEVRYFTAAELTSFISGIDDLVESQCAFQFRKMIDSVRNIYTIGGNSNGKPN